MTKIPTEIKLLKKLLHLHETQNGILIQKLEHTVAHEILRKHHGKEHRWRRIILPLGLLSAMLLSRLYHGGGGVALRDQIKLEVLRNKGGNRNRKHRAVTSWSCIALHNSDKKIGSSLWT
jgi:hypothetical protein